MKYTIGLKGLPFRPDPKQVIYVENEYNEAINNLIIKNYELIRSHFFARGYEFCYLPLLYKNFSDYTFSYYNPSGSQHRQPIESSFLLNYMARPQNRSQIPSSLIYYKEFSTLQESEDIALRGISIEDISLQDDTFSHLLDDIIADQADVRDIRFSIKSSSPEKSVPIYLSDENFDHETIQLVQEVAEKIKQLKQRGISAYALEELLCNPDGKVSRMVITPDYRIILPDYNDMEIVMTPLVKAVYLLFLRHDKGIPFKHLLDYRAELLQIYSDIRGGDLTDEMKHSVELATSPFNNSINEKCARIREAFVAKFDEHIAKYYFVTGKRGEPKRITLSRNLVEWE